MIDNESHVGEFSRPQEEAAMNALLKQAEGKVRTPVLATGRSPSAQEMHERVIKRYPKTMKRLGE